MRPHRVVAIDERKVLREPGFVVLSETQWKLFGKERPRRQPIA